MINFCPSPRERRRSVALLCVIKFASPTGPSVINMSQYDDPHICVYRLNQDPDRLIDVINYQSVCRISSKRHRRFRDWSSVLSLDRYHEVTRGNWRIRKMGGFDDEWPCPLEKYRERRDVYSFCPNREIRGFIQATGCTTRLRIFMQIHMFQYGKRKI